MLRLFAWNSFGAKWDAFWTNWLLPALGNNDDIAGVLMESGWAPWVLSGDVYMNATYDFERSASWFNHASLGNSAFCAGIVATRRRYGLWVPWVGNLNAMKTNSRCSMGAALLPDSRRIQAISTFETQLSIRPVVKLSMGIGSNTDITVLVVHLMSGYPAGAQRQLDELTAAMSKMIPQDTCGIIVGDMNINLLNTPLVAPPNWRIIRTGVATQQKGGELDWGILYDPTNQYGGTTVTVMQQYKTGPNTSDHSVLRYNIPL